MTNNQIDQPAECELQWKAAKRHQLAWKLINKLQWLVDASCLASASAGAAMFLI